ncbi:MAG: GatB/YqeY domain-containing protein [Chloroflexi bacterium]|nr:GatB/YqeY domain-containing protein [Chloroflexota bacterium]
MTLLERLAQEMKTAMLARNADRLATLRLLKSAVGYAQIERKTEALTDPEVIAIVQKEVKKRREAIEQFEKGKRPELAAKERLEITVLDTFLPEPLSPEELEQLIRAAIQETGATSKKEMGAVIKAAQAKAAGRADGKTNSSMVARLLP